MKLARGTRTPMHSATNAEVTRLGQRRDRSNKFQLHFDDETLVLKATDHTTYMRWIASLKQASAPLLWGTHGSYRPSP